MEMRGAPEWSDLAVAEAAGNRKLRKDIASDAHIAIGAAEQALAPTQTGEQQSNQGCLVPALISGGLQQLTGFQSRGLRFTQLELHVLSGTNAIGNGNCAVAWIHPDQIAHQKSSCGSIARGAAMTEPGEHGVGNQFFTFNAEEQ